MAFGGVEIGKHMAEEAAMAIPMSIVDVPPMELRVSPMPAHTTLKIGTNKAAVAVLEMKLDKK